MIAGLDGNPALNPTVHSLGGWINRRPWDTTLTRDTTSPISAPGSLMVTKTAAGGEVASVSLTGGYLNPTDIDDLTDPAWMAVPVTVGNNVTWSLDVRCEVDCDLDIGLFPFDADGNQIGWDVPGVGDGVTGVEEIHQITANTVTRVGCTILIPDGCVYATMTVSLASDLPSVAGTRTWFDNLLIEPDSDKPWVPPDMFGYHPPGVYDPNFYCDGDTPDYMWTGTPGESITVLTPPPATTEPPVAIVQQPVTLGCGEPTVYLYDRGGTNRLYRFEAGAVLSLDWERIVSDTGKANLLLDSSLCDCNWLGLIRSGRHELVIYRDAERVWEGPITRVAYSPSQVKIIASDLSWWLRRRALQTHFTTGNVVSVAAAMAKAAFYYDDPNVLHWLHANATKGEQFTAAYNRADGYYIDAFDDMVESGLEWAVMGRRLVMWASVNPIAQTNMLRTPQDLAAVLTVYEDAESLATRTFSTGGDTFGSAVLTGSDKLPAVAAVEPDIINYASNPSLKINTAGFDPYTTRFFTVTRATSGWSSAVGGTYGKLGVKIPAKGSDARSDYDAFEMVLSMAKQAITVAPGMLLSASLLVRPTGPDLKKTTLTLSWRGKKTDGTIDDRGFIEGPPVLMVNGADQQLFVTGVVPDDYVSAWVEVARDTTDLDWSNAADGFWFDKFAMWVGRQETWFDGDSTDTSTTKFSWLGSTGQSQSRRWWNNNSPRPPQEYPAETQYQDRLSEYYGVIDYIDDSRTSTTRPELEVEAKASLMRSFPAPLGIDIPQDAPLLPTAPVTINELMPGTIVPIQSRSTCRSVGAQPILESVKCAYSPQGEKITITLTTSQAWEIEPPAEPDVPDGGGDEIEP